MSEAMDSYTDEVTIFVRLLGEGTDVVRPAPALKLEAGTYRVLRTADYDPEDEEWEFPPGITVECEPQTRGGKEVLLAFRQA